MCCRINVLHSQKTCRLMISLKIKNKKIFHFYDHQVFKYVHILESHTSVNSSHQMNRNIFSRESDFLIANLSKLIHYTL